VQGPPLTPHWGTVIWKPCARMRLAPRRGPPVRKCQCLVSSNARNYLSSTFDDVNFFATQVYPSCMWLVASTNPILIYVHHFSTIPEMPIHFFLSGFPRSQLFYEPIQLSFARLSKGWATVIFKHFSPRCHHGCIGWSRGMLRKGWGKLGQTIRSVECV